jgi:hypothetical protein
MLRPKVLLSLVDAWEPQLMRWVSILVQHGGGEGGHYFTINMARLWHQMPQIILQFPYGGMDFRQDPNMVLTTESIGTIQVCLCTLCFVILIV